MEIPDPDRHERITAAQWAAIDFADYCVVGDPEYRRIQAAAVAAGIPLPAAGLVIFDPAVAR